MNHFIYFLTWVGLTHRTQDGKLFIPFSAPKTVNFMHWWRWHALHNAPIYVFRNRHGVTKWIPGRLLPWRWGFGIAGFEFGDRGSFNYGRCGWCYMPLHQFSGACVNRKCSK